ncbi:hypothetical protein CRV02_13200 [Arcobacter sp. CECT 8989]|uniref:hypothetical protein n=1 Tax=Arcobacter sp. CECT 8989 TaxID=2044509 RepID=UPI00100B9596|nr:hypothetical protein [Arcobacter sp. CECT 8989]RXJ98701.1 hypothetical protein CRV02_13200 [Arcobacter sp. CECT 8989]
MEVLLPYVRNILIGSIILILILLVFIYQSKLEKLKRFTTICLIGFFSWGLGKDVNTQIIVFIVITGFVLYIWNKMDKEKVNNMEKFLKYIDNINAYGKYLELNPLEIEEIRHSSKLPFKKENFILDSLIYIRVLEKEFQILILNSIPLLAYFRDDVPENGYISNISKIIKDNNNKNSTIEDLLNKPDEDNFPIDIYNKCNEESKRILKLLQASC